MALIVQKYGGTSVGSIERIQHVADKVIAAQKQGHQVVVVVSAMSGETNRLIGLAKEIQAQPDPRELDVIVSTGEQVTIGLLSMALMAEGLKAKSYTGAQVKILTDSAFTKARIVSIDEENIRADLDDDYVLVVAGFQGVDEEGINIQMISTSEIKISVVIDEKYLELAVRVLHKAFELDQEAA